MTWLDDALGRGIGADRGQHGSSAIGSGNTGSHALRGFDRNGEVGSHFFAVVADHQRQAQLLAALLGQGQADQAAAVLGHEVDVFRRYRLGGHDDVALVLAIFVIHQHDHLAGPDVVDDILRRVELHVEINWFIHGR